MPTIAELKERIDCNDLAQRLGLDRPGDRGNYRSPKHPDKSPSLSVFRGGKAWKDHSTEAAGSCIDLVMYVREVELGDALRELHELYGWDAAPRQPSRPAEPRTRAEYVADKCLADPDGALAYLTEDRALPKEVCQASIAAGTLGFNCWRSDKVAEGEVGHGGPAVAFIVRTPNPGHVAAVDLRYLEPAANGGVKTQTQGEKRGVPWISDHRVWKRAKTVYVVESPINALSVESCGLKSTAALATRGVGTVEAIDWRELIGKRVVLAMDNDKPDDRGRRPGPEAAWRIQEILVGLNISAHLVDQGEWEHNDVNDVLKEEGAQELRHRLQRLEPWVIPGVRGDNLGRGKPRLFLPQNDFEQYWKYRAKEDFTTYVKVRVDESGDKQEEFTDLCSFRIASLSRVTISSITATMSGEVDAQPRTIFGVSVQLPRYNRLVRHVFKDEQLHSIDQWQKFGTVFARTPFMRMISILERGIEIGAREVINFVGIGWLNGKPVVNEGPDCYFSDPEKQCPYHNLTFPSGSAQDAAKVVHAYRETFTFNAATLLLTWGLGAHLKAFLGFWPHLMMQADKGVGKSTLIKRLERTLGFTMFSGQSLETVFRILTSVSHTSHPVGWEEVSARKQQTIDSAQQILQECYQYTVTRRGSDMTDYFVSAPVLLSGEDVPVRSLSGKLVRVELLDQGILLSETLPRFPVRQWLDFLVQQGKATVRAVYQNAHEYCSDHYRGTKTNIGARRMIINYAALLVAWRLIAKFAGMNPEEDDIVGDLITTMNAHIADTNRDREPWVWILEVLFNEISANHYPHPYKIARVKGEQDCLLVRPAHVIHHIKHNVALRDTWNALPIKSDRVFKRQLMASGVVFAEEASFRANGKFESRMTALSLDRLQDIGLRISLPDEPMDRA